MSLLTHTRKMSRYQLHLFIGVKLGDNYEKISDRSYQLHNFFVL